MPPINLTEGAIKMITSGKTPGINPVLQVTDISLIKMQNSNRKRFLIWLSDGLFTQKMILYAQNENDFVEADKLQKGSIVLLSMFNRIPNREIILIINLSVIHEKCDIIGEPQPFPTKTNWNVPSMARSKPQVQPMNQPLSGTGGLSMNSSANHDSQIAVFKLCYEDKKSIPQLQFHFRPISEIKGMENNTIGVVSLISPPASLVTQTLKRTLQMKDESVEESISIDLDFSKARKLKKWFNSKGKRTPDVSISREMVLVGTDVLKTIKQIEDEKLGISEEPYCITVCAIITCIEIEDFCYLACPNMTGGRRCKVSLTKNSDGKWRCDECNQVVDDCDYQYTLLIQIEDNTGSTWVTAFQEIGEEIMGISAKDLYCMKQEEETEEEFYQLVKKVLCTEFVFKLKVKAVYNSNDQCVAEPTVVKANKVTEMPDEMTKHKEEDSGSLPPKNEPAANYVNTPRETCETGASAIAVVKLCFEDDKSIPQLQFHFRPTSEIKGMENNTVTDLISVVSSISPPASLMTETRKRKRQLEDESVEAISIDLDFPRVRKLKTWLDNKGKRIPAVSISREMGLARTDLLKTMYLPDQISNLKEEESVSLPLKNEPAVNYVSTFPEAGASATPMGSYGTQYNTGSRFPSSGSSCNSCDGSGHSSANCPTVMTGPGQSYGRESPVVSCGGIASGEC